MKHDLVAEFEASLIGRSCAAKRGDYDWSFQISGGHGLVVSAPWRIVCNERIAFASGDDGQLFGSCSPVDGEAEARKLLGGRSITSATLNKDTADLALCFDAATRIEVFNNSMGYEGWQANFAVHDRRWSLIAMGGGDLAFIEA